MPNTQHAPAPWKAGRSRYGHWVSIPVAAGDTSRGPWQCSAPTAADAKLIAKAPEMYEILAGMIDGTMDAQEIDDRATALIAELRA